jgi:hypothetical protein
LAQILALPPTVPYLTLEKVGDRGVARVRVDTAVLAPARAALRAEMTRLRAQLAAVGAL